MIEILKMCLNYGVALFFAVLFYMDFRKKIDRMEKTVDKDSANTAEVNKTMKGLKNVIENHLVHSIDKLTTEVRKLNDK